MTKPPKSEQQLLETAKNLAGCSIADLARRYQIDMPQNLRRNKGWVGQLLEKALGATASVSAEPDFPYLGVELKTIPLNEHNRPKESTFICTISLLKIAQMTWKTSTAYKKLARVLWIPIEANSTIPLGARRIGSPLFWSPSAEDEQILQQDWQELTDLISLGELDKVTARYGQYLQVRPKGANAKAVCWGINADGERVRTMGRGFYLRSTFTEKILNTYYQII